ncbi:hypothetical protein EE612_053081 [Oryza sativa]|nr:hypothetical protein EE612_053081 [Oryza sativa]
MISLGSCSLFPKVVMPTPSPAFLSMRASRGPFGFWLALFGESLVKNCVGEAKLLSSSLPLPHFLSFCIRLGLLPKKLYLLEELSTETLSKSSLLGEEGAEEAVSRSVSPCPRSDPAYSSIRSLALSRDFGLRVLLR